MWTFPWSVDSRWIPERSCTLTQKNRKTNSTQSHRTKLSWLNSNDIICIASSAELDINTWQSSHSDVISAKKVKCNNEKVYPIVSLHRWVSTSFKNFYLSDKIACAPQSPIDSHTRCLPLLDITWISRKCVNLFARDIIAIVCRVQFNPGNHILKRRVELGTEILRQ